MNTSYLAFTAPASLSNCNLTAQAAAAAPNHRLSFSPAHSPHLWTRRSHTELIIHCDHLLGLLPIVFLGFRSLPISANCKLLPILVLASFDPYVNRDSIQKAVTLKTAANSGLHPSRGTCNVYIRTRPNNLEQPITTRQASTDRHRLSLVAKAGGS